MQRATENWKRWKKILMERINMTKKYVQHYFVNLFHKKKNHTGN